VLDLLTWLRGTWNSSMPVMVLSERSGARDVARALDAGANDYVIKPFRSLELHARAYRFRSPGNRAPARAERLGDWTFLHDRSSMVHAGPPPQSYDLKEREFHLALALFRTPGVVVSRVALLDATNWVGGATAIRSLDKLVHRLRHNLGLDAKGIMLKMAYGKGYQLTVS
jgi:DNA-binding response OmpR family regulator